MRTGTSEEEKPWHRVVWHVMAMFVGVGSAAAGVMVVEWIIELFWETIFL